MPEITSKRAQPNNPKSPTNPEAVAHDEVWQTWALQLSKYDEVLTIERGGPPQEREGLDELFP